MNGSGWELSTCSVEILKLNERELLKFQQLKDGRFLICQTENFTCFNKQLTRERRREKFSHCRRGRNQKKRVATSDGNHIIYFFRGKGSRGPPKMFRVLSGSSVVLVKINRVDATWSKLGTLLWWRVNHLIIRKPYPRWSTWDVPRFVVTVRWCNFQYNNEEWFVVVVRSQCTSGSVLVAYCHTCLSLVIW